MSRRRNPSADDLMLPLLLGGGAVVAFLAFGKRAGAATGTPGSGACPPGWNEREKGWCYQSGSTQRKGIAVAWSEYNAQPKQNDAAWDAWTAKNKADSAAASTAASTMAKADLMLRKAGEAYRSIEPEHVKALDDIIGPDMVVPASMQGLGRFDWQPDIALSYGAVGHVVPYQGLGIGIPGASYVSDAYHAVKGAGGKLIKVATKFGDKALDYASDPVGSARAAGSLVLDGTVAAADLVKKGAVATYKIGNKIVGIALDPQHVIRKGTEYVERAVKELSDPKRLLKIAWEQVLKLANSEVIRAILRAIVRPMIDIFKKVLEEGLPATLALGGGAALADILHQKGQSVKVWTLARPIVAAGAGKISAETIGRLKGFLPDVPGVRTVFSTLIEKPLKETIASLLVAVASGQAQEAVSIIAGAGILSPATITVTKAANMLKGFATGIAVSFVVKSGESQARSLLNAVAITGDLQNMAIDALKNPI